MKATKILGLSALGYGIYAMAKPAPRQVVPQAPVYQNINTQAAYRAWLAWTQNVLNQAVSTFGTLEKALRELRGIFAKTPLPEYDAGSIFWQDATAGMAGIGKTYDSFKIKPAGRVDQYWAGQNISPGKVGVEARREKHFFDVQVAVKHFRLFGLEFGNWVPQDERGEMMYGSLVTLADMAKVTGNRHDQMGMGSQLHLAFGARGKGGFAAAFYQRHPYHLINLTRTAGKGTFCHEFGHAMDTEAHYRRFRQIGYISGGRTTRHTPQFEGLRPGTPEFHMEKTLEIILWKEDGEPTTYKKFLRREDSDYLNRRTEIWARTIEGFFHIKFERAGIKNTWGVTRGWGDDWPEKSLVEKAMPHIQKVISYALK